MAVIRWSLGSGKYRKTSAPMSATNASRYASCVETRQQCGLISKVPKQTLHNHWSHLALCSYCRILCLYQTIFLLWHSKGWVPSIGFRMRLRQRERMRGRNPKGYPRRVGQTWRPIRYVEGEWPTNITIIWALFLSYDDRFSTHIFSFLCAQLALEYIPFTWTCTVGTR